MKKLVASILVTLVFGFSSCIPDTIDIDVTPADPELCIASIVMGNTGIIISLTRSYSPLESSPGEDTLSDNVIEQILVTGATVTINYGSQTDTLYEVTPGVYCNL